jgi:hypothetical protein
LAGRQSGSGAAAPDLGQWRWRFQKSLKNAWEADVRTIAEDEFATASRQEYERKRVNSHWR